MRVYLSGAISLSLSRSAVMAAARLLPGARRRRVASAIWLSERIISERHTSRRAGERYVSRTMVSPRAVRFSPLQWNVESRTEVRTEGGLGMESLRDARVCLRPNWPVTVTRLLPTLRHALSPFADFCHFTSSPGIAGVATIEGTISEETLSFQFSL